MSKLQRVPLSDDLKAYQILALCYHFYNNNQCVSEIDTYYHPPQMIINPVLDLTYKNMTRTTFKYIKDNVFEFEFDNLRYDVVSYKQPIKTSFNLRYNGIFLENNIVYNIYGDAVPYEASIKKVRYHFKEKDDDKRENIKNNYHKAQQLTINKLKFYEENCLDVYKLFTDSRHGYNNKLFTIDFMFNMKKYIGCIDRYSRKGLHNTDSIRSILKAFEEDMQVDNVYNFKLLRFQKTARDSLKITFNKTFDFSLYSHTLKNATEDNNIDSIFNILIPVYEEIGGYKELQNVILHNRILTE